MKETRIPLLYMGLCSNPNCSHPYHYVPVHAVIDLSELPDKCDSCNQSIHWEYCQQRHETKRKRKGTKLKDLLDSVPPTEVFTYSCIYLLGSFMLMTGVFIRYCDFFDNLGRYLYISVAVLVEIMLIVLAIKWMKLSLDNERNIYLQRGRQEGYSLSRVRARNHET